MKKTILFLLLAALFSCEKEDPIDPCEGVVCLNGGTCETGTCNCINGYSGADCATPQDPCAGITCLNGGVCANGVCNCPTGYTGGDCSLQATPARINILAITVTKFPATGPGGSSWDVFDGGDVYVSLALNGTELVNNRPQFVEDATSPPIHFASLGGGWEMDEVTNEYTLSVFDKDDFGADEFMGSKTFAPYSETNGFPQTIEVGCAGCAVAFTLVLDYDF